MGEGGVGTSRQLHMGDSKTNESIIEGWRGLLGKHVETTSRGPPDGPDDGSGLQKQSRNLCKSQYAQSGSWRWDFPNGRLFKEVFSIVNSPDGLSSKQNVPNHPTPKPTKSSTCEHIWATDNFDNFHTHGNNYHSQNSKQAICLKSSRNIKIETRTTKTHKTPTTS